MISIENVYGSAFGDTLMGDSGSNVLSGRNGDDILAGRGGDDELWGGNGADTFIFGDGFGRDIIVDFEADVDKIDLADTNFDGWNDFFNGGDRYMQQEGADVVLHYYDDTIELESTQIADLSETDFLF